MNEHDEAGLPGVGYTIKKRFCCGPSQCTVERRGKIWCSRGKKKESLIWNQVIYILNLGSTMNLSVKMSKSFLLSFFMCKRSGD